MEVGINKKMSTIEATVIRCGCTEEQKAASDWHAKRVPAQVCPNPRVVEDYGVISFWHRNPLKRLRYWLIKKLRRGPVYFSEVK